MSTVAETEMHLGLDPDAQVAEAVAHGPQCPYLVFGAGNSLYAFRCESVLHVDLPQPLVKVPTAPAEVLGVTRVRGRVVGVLDLAALLGIERAVAAKRADAGGRLIVVDAGEACFGIEVDRIVGLCVKAPETIRPGDAVATGQARSDIVEACFDEPEGVVAALCPPALLGRLGGAGAAGVSASS